MNFYMQISAELPLPPHAGVRLQGDYRHIIWPFQIIFYSPSHGIFILKPLQGRSIIYVTTTKLPLLQVSLVLFSCSYIFIISLLYFWLQLVEFN